MVQTREFHNFNAATAIMPFISTYDDDYNPDPHDTMIEWTEIVEAVLAGSLSVPANKNLASGICFGFKSATGLPAEFATNSAFSDLGTIDNLVARIGGNDFAVATCFIASSSSIYLYNSTPALVTALPANITFQLKGVDYVSTRRSGLTFGAVRYSLAPIAASLAALQNAPIIIGIAGDDGFFGDGAIPAAAAVHTSRTQKFADKDGSGDVIVINTKKIFAAYAVVETVYANSKTVTILPPIYNSVGSGVHGVRSNGFTISNGDADAMAEQDIQYVDNAGVVRDFSLRVFNGGFTAMWFDALSSEPAAGLSTGRFRLIIGGVDKTSGTRTNNSGRRTYLWSGGSRIYSGAAIQDTSGDGIILAIPPEDAGFFRIPVVAPAIPANALACDSDPLTIAGDYITC